MVIVTSTAETVVNLDPNFALALVPTSNFSLSVFVSHSLHRSVLRSYRANQQS
jgi:hypothetical protein